MFETWAPPESPWSAWAKPALFAQPPLDVIMMRTLPLPPRIDTVPWPKPSQRTAIIIDLPGITTARLAIAAAAHGYRPVPLFNTTHGHSALIDVTAIVKSLLDDSAELAAIALPADAPPAFMLDADRLSKARRSPGMFDNRWIVLPQDFPSATRLLSADIRSILLIRERDLTPETDLRTILRTYQRAGLEVNAITLTTPDAPRAPVLTGWASLGLLTAFAASMLGLRRNWSGGFGGQIPHPSQG